MELELAYEAPPETGATLASDAFAGEVLALAPAADARTSGRNEGLATAEIEDESMTSGRARLQRVEQELFEHYHKQVYHELLRRCREPMLAQDLTQETLIVVLKRLRAGTIADVDRLGAFVLQTARYLYIGWVRREVSRNTVVTAAPDAVVGNGPEQDADAASHRRQLLSCIGSLKVERDREILLRACIYDEDKQAICAALDLSTSHFHRVLSRAQQRLRAVSDAAQLQHEVPGR